MKTTTVSEVADLINNEIFVISPHIQIIIVERNLVVIEYEKDITYIQYNLSTRSIHLFNNGEALSFVAGLLELVLLTRNKLSLCTFDVLLALDDVDFSGLTFAPELKKERDHCVLHFKEDTNFLGTKHAFFIPTIFALQIFLTHAASNAKTMFDFRSNISHLMLRVPFFFRTVQ